MRLSRPLALSALWLLLSPFANSYAADGDIPDPFVHPAALERDIRFWIRVYTEVTTDQGLIHDDWNLGLVYEVLRFDPASSPSQRERRVTEAKAKYAALLRRFAQGSTDNMTAHEQRILHAFGDNATSSDYRDAIDRIRFQLGQADRFHEGLIRAAVWEKQIARTLVQHGVPAEIAALPHVESSFNLAAYSKVGAAGLWQFMPSTAKRYMRVDSLVDERLDPYTATEAAANLMLYNYRLVGTWPLTVTAYNHGPGGLRRAQDELGTSDIAVIVKRFQGATFGFASRNFYVAFLAALEVDRNAEKYFGPMTRLPETESTPVELPDYISVDALAKSFRVDMGALRVLNPALRPPIWNGSRLVPRGYRLRLPGTVPAADVAAGWARLPPNLRYVAQRNDGSHRLRRGETLAGVAAASGVSLPRLLASNGWSSTTVVARGELVRIPMPASRADIAGGGPAAAAAAESLPSAPPASNVAAVLPDPVANSVPAPAATPPVQAKADRPPREPVSERQTANTDGLLPAASPTGSSDTTNYAVGANNTVIVQAAGNPGALCGLDPGGFTGPESAEQASQECHGDPGQEAETGSIQGVGGGVRGGAARLSSSPARNFLRRQSHCGDRNLRGEARRLAVDHLAAARRAAGLAGGAIQSGREFQRHAAGNDADPTASRRHQSAVMPRA